MIESELKALSIDLLALKAVVRALVRAQSRRSLIHRSDLLDSLRQESEAVASFPPNDLTHSAALTVREAWIEELSTTAQGA